MFRAVVVISRAYCCWKSKWCALLEKHSKRWSDQHKTSRFLAKFALKITPKSAVFLPIAFRPSLPWKFPRNSREINWFFHDFFPKNPVKFDFFFRELSEALHWGYQTDSNAAAHSGDTDVSYKENDVIECPICMLESNKYYQSIGRTCLNVVQKMI